MLEPEWIWGIDVATAHLEFACVALDTIGTAFDTVEIDTLITRTEERDGARLGLLDRQLRIYARQRASAYPPACVWVEQPAGKFVMPVLWYTVGVLQAALFETLACPVWTIPPGAWKKRTVGNGNATKAMVQAWLNGIATDVEFRDEHQADAAAIALAGRAMFASLSWDATA